MIEKLRKKEKIHEHFLLKNLSKNKSKDICSVLKTKSDDWLDSIKKKPKKKILKMKDLKKFDKNFLVEETRNLNIKMKLIESKFEQLMQTLQKKMQDSLDTFSNLTDMEHFDFKKQFEKHFNSFALYLENNDFMDLRKEFSHDPKSIEEEIENLKNNFEFEEKHFNSSWKFNFDQKFQEFKLIDIKEKFKLSANLKLEELTKDLQKEMHELLNSFTNLKSLEKFDFLSKIEKRFISLSLDLEDHEFKELRELSDNQSMEKEIQDLKNNMKLVENNFLFSWKIDFDQKIQDFKLKDLEQTFFNKLNAKQNELINKSNIIIENQFEDFATKTLTQTMDFEFQEKSEDEEILAILTNFNRFKRKNMENITKKTIDEFKNKNEFSQIDWVSHQDIPLNENIMKKFNSFFKNIHDDFKVIIFTEKMANDFFRFLENISDDQLVDVNSDLFYSEKCCYFILELSKVISRNKTRQKINIINKWTNAKEKIVREFKETLQNRKKGLQFLKEFCMNFFYQLRENEIIEFKKGSSVIIDDTFKKIMIDPQDSFNSAYHESFTMKDPRAIYHYVTNINGFIIKILRKKVKEIVNDVFEKLATKFQEKIKKKVENFEKNLIDFMKSYKNKGSLTFMIENVSDDLHAKYPNIYYLNQNFGYQIPIKEFEKIFKNMDFSSKTEAEIIILNQRWEFDQKTKDFLQRKQNIIKGCQVICPGCKSKCMKASENHKDHSTIHIINCFGSVHFRKSKEVNKAHCLESQNIESTWYYDGITYPNLIEYYRDKHPSWVIDFIMNQKKLIDFERENQLICWNYVRKPLLKKYAKYQIMDSFNNNIQLDGELPENYVNSSIFIFNYFIYFDIIGRNFD